MWEHQVGRKPIDLELSFRLNHPESTVCCDVVIQEHMDVLCLVVLAGIGALLTEVFEYDTPLNLIMLKTALPFLSFALFTFEAISFA